MGDHFNDYENRDFSPSPKIDLDMSMKSPLRDTMYPGELSNMNKSMMNSTQRSKNNGYFGVSFVEKNPLNTSKAKQMFSFSQSNRFQNYKNSQNPHIQYDLPGLFDKTAVQTGQSKAFGSSQRFDYYPRTNHHKNPPSPDKYEIKSQFTPQNKSRAYSFGLAREQMYKMHIQAIEDQAKNQLPGPGQYQPPKTFGKDGVKFSMRPNTGYDLILLSKQKQFPGPGQYVQPDLVGTQNSVKLTSIVKTPQSPSFPKAKDRFEIPTFKNGIPGPGNYTPKNNLNENIYSLYRSLGHTKFSKDERKALNDKLYRNVEYPGPGNYELPSDFGRYEPPNFSIMGGKYDKRRSSSMLKSSQ
eukprot:403368482